MDSAALSKSEPPTDFRAYPDHSRLMNRAVRAMKKDLAKAAAPRRQSLFHIDLRHHLRLAFISTPEGNPGAFGRSSVRLPVFSLRW
jgi:hypothetical protein